MYNHTMYTDSYEIHLFTRFINRLVNQCQIMSDQILGWSDITSDLLFEIIMISTTSATTRAGRQIHRAAFPERPPASSRSQTV